MSLPTGGAPDDGGGPQLRLRIERADNRAAMIGAIPSGKIKKRGRRFLIALADLCWERTGGPSSGDDPISLGDIAERMNDSVPTARRAKDETCPHYADAVEVPGIGYFWTVKLSRINDESSWVPAAPGKLPAVPRQSERGSPDKLPGVGLQVARGPSGDPPRALERKELKTQRSRAQAELLKLAEGKWPNAISKADLSDAAWVQHAWSLALKIGHFENCDRWRCFIFQAAVQARRGDRRSPGGLFTMLVAAKSPGEHEFPDVVIREAHEMMRRLGAGERRKPEHPDLGSDSGPSRLGTSVLELVGAPAEDLARSEEARPQLSKEEWQAKLREFERSQSSEN
jgi:hypothetical protein